MITSKPLIPRRTIIHKIFKRNRLKTYPSSPKRILYSQVCDAEEYNDLLQNRGRSSLAFEPNRDSIIITLFGGNIIDKTHFECNYNSDTWKQFFTKQEYKDSITWKKQYDVSLPRGVVYDSQRNMIITFNNHVLLHDYVMNKLELTNNYIPQEHKNQESDLDDPYEPWEPRDKCGICKYKGECDCKCN